MASPIEQPRILIIYTGGTIGMTTDPRTGTLVPFDFGHLMESVPKVGRLGYRLDHVELVPAIDSSNMNPQHWGEICEAIANAYGSYDGFVVLHGTDTMAYTASALSFMLGNVAKPVILTGSQLPIGEIREDGTGNLITALQIAAARDASTGAPMVQEVAICFGSHLWRGNRAIKVSSTDFGAFRSYNYPALANMDLHIDFNEKALWRSAGNTPLRPAYAMDDAVGVVFVYPGVTEGILRSQLEAPGIKGFVLRTYGAGNAPTEPWFLAALHDAVGEGKVIVNGKRVGKDVDFPEDIGVIIETPGFLPNLTGMKNLEILASLQHKIGKERIQEVLQTVGLDPKLKKPVSKYSLGMRQRLGIAQAVMEDPSILILDEPFNGLDKKGVKQMHELILSLKGERKTILLSSHSQNDIDVLCDTVCEMDAGTMTCIRERTDEKNG